MNQNILFKNNTVTGNVDAQNSHKLVRHTPETQIKALFSVFYAPSKCIYRVNVSI